MALCLGSTAGRIVILLSALVLPGLLSFRALSRVPSTVWLSVVSTLAAAIIVRLAFSRRDGRVRCYLGNGDDLKRVYDRMPSARIAPEPPVWCSGPYMQFLPWVLYNLLIATLAPLPFEVEEVEVCGLVDKSKPESESNPRNVRDTVTVNYFPPVSNGAAQANLPLDAPAIFVDPGLTCTAQDVPGSSLMRRACLAGFRVVVLERRGHHAPLRSPRFNLFGDIDDFEQVYHTVAKRLTGAPLFWVGLSSGSKLVVEGLGKFDRRRAEGDNTAPSFVAACCLCPGYNLETCFDRFAFPFAQMCLANAKSMFVGQNEKVLRAYDEATYEKVMGSTSLSSMLFAAAPFAGYPSSTEYFAAENPVLFTSHVRTPTLLVNAEDDPMTVVANAFEKSPFQEDGATFVEQLERSPCGMLLISSTGSHCPFLDGRLWPFERVPMWLGGFILNSWCERCTLEFFAGYLEETGRGEKARRASPPGR